MMRRLIGFLVTVALGLLMAPLAVEAQQAGRVYRIGYLLGTTREQEPALEAFLEGMHALGYVEGQNLVMEYRAAEGQYERLPALAAEAAAQRLGVQLHVVEARGPEAFDRAFAAMTQAHAEALLVMGDRVFVEHRRRLAELAAMSHLPTMHNIRPFVEAGGLMAYGPSPSDIRRRAAVSVDKLLKGAKPADLPVEQPMKFDLVINLKTAQALGLTIPSHLLFQADEVIR